VFLDVDGVLNSEAFLRKHDEQHHQLGHHRQCECYRHENQIDRDAVARLNRIIAETGAKIVVSSSWRKLLDPPELHRVLVSHGLVAEIIGETPDGPNDPEMRATFGDIDRIFRGHEIDLWLRKHPEVDRWVILDDASDMEMHTNRLVQTDCEEGLLDEHVDLAIRVLAWDGKTTPSPMDETPTRVELFESSWGMHCNQKECCEKLTLKRTISIAPSYERDERDYEELSPALYEAAVSLGWRLYHSVLWCPTHVLTKKLACTRCASPCPACSCVGGPLLEAVDSGDVTPAVKARVSIAVAKIGVGGEEDQADKRADDRFSRLRELLVRLVQPGPKAAGVSASELHEVVEDAYTLLDERTKIAQWIADETDTVGLIRATEKIREILTGGE
jgi:hypothetical protein